MLNKLRCHPHFQFSDNQITWSRLLIQIYIFNGKECRSRSVGFFRSQLIWIYTVCKDRTYPGSAGLGTINRYTLTGKYTRLAIDESVLLLSNYKLAPNVSNSCPVFLNCLHSMEFLWTFLFAEITWLIVFALHTSLLSVVCQKKCKM